MAEFAEIPGSVISSTLCVNFAFLALFALNCFKGFLHRKVRKEPQRSAKKSSKLGHYPDSQTSPFRERACPPTRRGHKCLSKTSGYVRSFYELCEEPQRWAKEIADAVNQGRGRDGLSSSREPRSKFKSRNPIQDRSSKNL